MALICMVLHTATSRLNPLHQLFQLNTAGKMNSAVNIAMSPTVLQDITCELKIKF